MDGLKLILQILLLIVSVLTVVLVLMHKGRGGGMSDMFGGGISSSLGSSGVAERNLNRLTIFLGVFWGLLIVAIGLITKFSGDF